MKRLALVFGGSRGIGAACVKTVADQGFDVAYTYVKSASREPRTYRAAAGAGFPV